MEHLEHPLALAEPRKAVVAEVRELHAALLDARPCVRREDDLPARRGRRDAGGTVDLDPDVGAAVELGLARMDPHPNARLGAARPLVCGQRPLRRDRGGDGVHSPLERGEQLVRAAVHDVPAGLLDR